MPRPRVNDNVWVEGFKQPNGKIVNIDWHDKEVHVLCHDTLEMVVAEFDEFDTLNTRLNQWIIHRT